jgi:hypothetical protein
MAATLAEIKHETAYILHELICGGVTENCGVQGNALLQQMATHIIGESVMLRWNGSALDEAAKLYFGLGVVASTPRKHRLAQDQEIA